MAHRVATAEAKQEMARVGHADRNDFRLLSILLSFHSLGHYRWILLST